MILKKVTYLNYQQQIKLAMSYHINSKDTPKADKPKNTGRVLSQKQLEVTQRLHNNSHVCTKGNCGCKAKEPTTKLVNQNTNKHQNASTSAKNKRLDSKLSINTQEKSDGQSTSQFTTPRQSIENPEGFKQKKNILLDRPQESDKNSQQKSSTGRKNSQQKHIQLRVPERVRKPSSMSEKYDQRDEDQQGPFKRERVFLVDSSTQTISFQAIRGDQNDIIQRLQKDVLEKSRRFDDQKVKIQELMLQTARLKQENIQLKQRQKQYKESLLLIQQILDPESCQSNRQQIERGQQLC